MPSTLGYIGNNCFKSCSNLVEVDFPVGLRFLGSSAFNGCTSLREVTLPLGLNNLKDRVFEGCTNLERFEMKGTLKDFGKDIFKGCVNLETVVLSGVAFKVSFDKELENIFRDCKDVNIYINGKFYKRFVTGLIKDVESNKETKKIGY